ncbi:hypothetical protein FXO38_04238 [Capsicum annuum]|uniref:HECT-type E3 ubiquitin transferase n=1 Tax=Capsicum annuum TaxID=4072 RepID=A0A2G2YU73_CAPAN|nr:hypothetical protein FXO38_04238 [Capsicum annuum]KAF3682258.1 hypothetical protein FXO37_02443 [Capsicum annuum]PHT73195.1 hypothetical protein T459_23980 [Capsicum annuum]
MKGVMSFEKRKKLSPRYIDPSKILRTVGDVAYELALPLDLSDVHLIFHVSILCTYITDESHVIHWDAEWSLGLNTDSGGGAGGEDDDNDSQGLLNHKNNPNIRLLAARALTYLVDNFPSSYVAILHYGAVSCFVARLLTIKYMDLAKQALKKISQVHPSACLRAGTLMVMLSYLNFFSARVQFPSYASNLVLPMYFLRLGNERILGSSLNPLNPLKIFTSLVPALPRCMPENVKPRLRTSCCPRCKEKYDLELAKLIYEFENSSSEAKLESPRPQLPQWLENDILKNDSNVTSLSQDIASLEAASNNERGIVYGANAYWGEEKVNRYVHLLNSTLTATERTACWILENYYKEDGVEIPKVLWSYMSGKTFIPFQEMSIDLSLEDVKHVALHYGFVFEKESIIKTTYTTNSRSMLQDNKLQRETTLLAANWGKLVECQASLDSSRIPAKKLS